MGTFTQLPQTNTKNHTNVPAHRARSGTPHQTAPPPTVNTHNE